MTLALPVRRSLTPRHRAGWAWPLLPALATVLLLAAPVPAGDVSAAGKVTPADAASALLVLTCAVRLLRERRRVLTPAAALILGAPVIGFAVAAATSLDPGVGLAGFLRYAQVFVLVPASLVLLLRDRRDAAAVAGSVVVLALVQGGIGVWQYATATGASYQGENVRAVGTFGPSDVMGMATVVAYGVVIAVGYALAPSRSPWVRPTALVCAGALLVPLTVSFSRGTWIATAVACTAMTLLAGRREVVRASRVLLALAACAVLLLVGGLGAGGIGAGAGGAGSPAVGSFGAGADGAGADRVGPGVIGSGMIGERVASITRITDAPDSSVTDRYALWAAALSMWREHPLTGVGLKRFPAERDSHASLALSSAGDTSGAGRPFAREPLLSPHNMYLLTLSEQGLLGCALLTGSWTALLTASTTRLLRTRRATRQGSPVGLAATGLLLWTCVDFLYADIGGPATVLTATVLGLSAWWALNPSPDGRPR